MHNKLEKAEKHYKTAIELHSINTTAMKHLAVIYSRTNRKDEAVKIWHRIREIAPDDPDLKKVFTPSG